MVDQELKDEMRNDMLMEAREEAGREHRLHDSYDYFIEQCGILDMVDDLRVIKKMCDDYGYSFTDVLEEV